MARKSWPHHLAGELYHRPTSLARPKRMTRELDLDVEQEPPSAGIQKNVSRPSWFLKEKNCNPLTWAAVGFGVVFVCGLTSLRSLHTGERSWRSRRIKRRSRNQRFAECARRKYGKSWAAMYRPHIFLCAGGGRPDAARADSLVESGQALMRSVTHNSRLKFMSALRWRSRRVGPKFCSRTVGTLMDLPGQRQKKFPFPS